MKLKYIYKAIKSQGPFKRAFTNFIVTGNAWGMFSKRAHWTYDGKEKIGRSTREKAQKMADSMRKKYGNSFSPYYCPWCGKWHIGRNRNDRLRAYEIRLLYNGITEYKTIEATSEKHAIEKLGSGAKDFYHDITVKFIK